MWERFLIFKKDTVDKINYVKCPSAMGSCVCQGFEQVLLAFVMFFSLQKAPWKHQEGLQNQIAIFILFATRTSNY